ncbi:MAG TPA: MmcQ/YjbR family DNA-binding protein [Campylobacterales bacterium]|nr:MmcQ/YjbR family DNA-binding protein [Campylobacterales bacterium]
MNFEKLDAYLLSKKGAAFDYPFDDKVRVYRVGGKIFALVGDNKPLAINLKCNPLYALELRSLHKSIKPGYHMNKKHWNTVETDGDVDDMTLEELIDHSYNLVTTGLTKKSREALV